MNNIKKVFSLGIVVLAFLFIAGFSVNKVEAAARTASVDGNWTNTATWGGQSAPVAGDTVTINTDIVVIVNTAVEAASITINDPVAADNGITIQTGGSVTLTGALTYSGSSGAGHSTVAVADGALSAGSISITDGAGAGNMVLSASTGTITSTGNFTFTITHAADVQITSTGASNINIGGHFPSGATFTRGSSTVTFNGSGAQNIGAYSYHNITIDKSAGTATLIGNTLILNELLVDSGTFDSSTFDLDITFLTTISSGATLIHGTGTKIQNGILVIESGGTWTESGAAVVQFLGHITNNGTFTANTGLHTFMNFTRNINGTFSIPNVSFNTNAVYTNNGTLTISTSLGGDGELINGAGATLNIGDDIVDNAVEGLTLTATATGNTVNYNRAGGQTVFDTDYYNLTLSGSGIKTVPDIDVSFDLVLDPAISAVVLSDGSTTTTGGLKLGGSWKSAGTWGSTGSAATNQNNTYFAVANTGIITSTLSHTSNVINSSDADYNDTTTTSDDDEDTDEDADDKEGVTIKLVEGCNPGYVFSAVTGEKCPTNITIITPSQTTVFGNSYAFGTTTVKMGTKGEACKAWQMFLNTKGSNLVVDGWCGAKTIAAAKTWQASALLTADGILGPLSRAKAMTQ